MSRTVMNVSAAVCRVATPCFVLLSILTLPVVAAADEREEAGVLPPVEPPASAREG